MDDGPVFLSIFLSRFLSRFLQLLIALWDGYGNIDQDAVITDRECVAPTMVKRFPGFSEMYWDVFAISARAYFHTLFETLSFFCD